MEFLFSDHHYDIFKPKLSYMKSINLLNLSACMITLCLFCGCTQKQDSKLHQNAGGGNDPSKKCYRAVYERDTALLSVIRKGSIIAGNLRFHYANGTIEQGTIKGVVKGDTLLADFHRKSYDGRWYRNPLAFLEAGTKLNLGVGQFEFAWGRAFFPKDAVIDYTKGRFVFEQTDCLK
jgi:hypothetical protein